MAVQVTEDKVMTKEELNNVFKYIVAKCDKIINNNEYVADDFVEIM